VFHLFDRHVLDGREAGYLTVASGRMVAAIPLPVRAALVEGREFDFRRAHTGEFPAYAGFFPRQKPNPTG
jgi:hypothetical protein